MTSRFSDPDFPVRSSRSLIASFLMDSRGIVVIIEGKEFDPFVYSMIVPQHLEDEHMKYDIIRIETVDQSEYGLEKGAGGKNAVLSFFDWCNENKFLFGGNSDSKYYLVFALDKDLDDFKSKIKVSNHIVYTNHYDIEGLLYYNANLIEILAAATSADVASVRMAMGSLINTKRLAERWRDWASLCYANDVLGIHDRGIGFNPSRINNPYDSNINTAQLEVIKATVISKAALLGISPSEVEEKILEAKKIIDSEEYFRVFKGKWYTTLLSSIANSKLRPLGYDVRLIEHKITSSIKSSVDYSTIVWNEMRIALSIGAAYIASA